MRGKGEKKRKSYHLQQQWMDLEVIMLSEVNETEKGKYYMDLTHMWNLENHHQTHRERNQRWKMWDG